jgi:hypothetical protein
MRSPTRALGARSATVAVVAALALATGGIAYGASVVTDGSSTAELQPDKGTPGPAPGGTADMQAPLGVQPSKKAPQGSTAGMRP